jgi:hypothetical protein
MYVETSTAIVRGSWTRISNPLLGRAMPQEALYYHREGSDLRYMMFLAIRRIAGAPDARYAKIRGFAHYGCHVFFAAGIMVQIEGIVGSLIYGSGAEVTCSAILAPRCHIPGIAGIRRGRLALKHLHRMSKPVYIDVNELKRSLISKAGPITAQAMAVVSLVLKHSEAKAYTGVIMRAYGWKLFKRSEVLLFSHSLQAIIIDDFRR